MIVVDPVTLGDASFSGGGGTYWDKYGVLQTGAPGVPRITYDPADLSKPPAVLLEPEATNCIRNNTMQGVVAGSPGSFPANWSASPVWDGLALSVVGKGVENGIEYIDIRYAGTVAVGNLGNAIAFEPNDGVAATAGQHWENSVFLKLVAGSFAGLAAFPLGIATWQSNASTNVENLIGPSLLSQINGEMKRFSLAMPSAGTLTGFVQSRIRPLTGAAGSVVDFTLRIGLPQLERDRVTSPIKTTNAAVTRAADVVGSTAGLLYSNVPETEPLWVAGTYAKGAKVRDGAHVAWESLVDGNTAALPSKTNANWLSLGATNRHAMFDDRNNTQTSNPEEVIVVLSPRAIAQGLLLGNLDASEVGVSVTVPNFGVVQSKVSSLVVSTSGSSFFRWGFNRIRRKTLLLSLDLPIYFNGVVTVSIRKPGGVPKCGMCLIGPIVEPGPTFMGLSTEIKDYSTTIFNTDGSSETTPRGYRKLMSMDVSIDTENIVQAEDQMIAWKQKTVAWIGAAHRPDSVIVGRYSSFKKVIESYPRSKMSLQIEGVLS